MKSSKECPTLAKKCHGSLATQVTVPKLTYYITYT